jgi:hypothetical protein
MKNSAITLILLLLAAASLSAQTTQGPPPTDYSGMYAFLQEGEFVQITVDDQGQVTGLVSRFSDSEGDKREFVDQYFKEGKLDGNRLTFTTKIVRNAWYDFQGTIERGDAQNNSDEGFYVLKGKLTQYKTDAAKKTTAKAQDVAFKSFPKETDTPLAK